LNGFFIDRNTFLKADEADLVMVLRRDEDGRAAEKPMIILKKVVEMTVDSKGKVVAVENKPELGVWVDALEHALERFNK
jgi:predicted RNase H-like nuclease (RuvC/YqgF family)